MRGLPPQPDDVAEMVFIFDVNGARATSTHWLFVPSLPAAGVPGLQALAGEVMFGALPFFTSLMHAGARVAALELVTRGTLSTRMVLNAPPNHGAWTGGQAAQVALGLHWLTSEAGAANHVVTHVPGFPDVFSDDGQALNDLAIGNAGTAAHDFLQYCSLIAGPIGGTALLGTLHRSRAGAPLSAAVFAPFTAVIPTRKVATIRRRVYGRR